MPSRTKNCSTWMTVAEAAKTIGCHRNHVRHLIKRGRLKAKKFGRVWQVHYVKVFEYAEYKPSRGWQRGKPRS